MLHSILKSTLGSAKCCYIISLSPVHELYFLNLRSLSSLTTKPKSENPNQSSYAANYLVNTFGLSQETALEYSKELKFKIPEKPEALIAFFKQHGFTDAQISRIIRKNPKVLTMKLQGNLLPKIQFFDSLGFSNGETAKIIAAGPLLLLRSLENKLIPTYEYLKNMLTSKEHTLFAIKRYSPLLYDDKLQRVVPTNIERLLKAGVPKKNVLHVFKQQPKVLMIQPEMFNVYVEKIEGMGFNPYTTNFLSAIYVMRNVGELKWNRKVEAYKKWGISETEVLVAFRKSPWCMATSVAKIERVLKYFVTDMGFDPLILMVCPLVMGLSLEKSIVPRCSVYQVLVSKGLIRKNSSLSAFMKQSRKSFLEKFVLRFSEEAPEILKLYPQKLHLSK